MVKPMCYPYSLMVFPKCGLCVSMEMYKITHWDKERLHVLKYTYYYLNRMHTQNSYIVTCVWIEAERRELTLLVSLCNSAEIIWIQFQNIGGTSQRDGYDHKHRRLLELEKVPHTRSPESIMSCCLPASPPASPTNHPNETSIRLMAPKMTHGHTHCF